MPVWDETNLDQFSKEEATCEDDRQRLLTPLSHLVLGAVHTHQGKLTSQA